MGVRGNSRLSSSSSGHSDLEMDVPHSKLTTLPPRPYFNTDQDEDNHHLMYNPLKPLSFENATQENVLPPLHS